MMGVRMAAALMLSAVCGGIGYSAARVQVRRRRALEEIGRAVDRLEIDMLEKRLPLEEALSGAGHMLFKKAAGYCRDMEPDKALRRAAGELSGSMGALDALTEDDMTAVYHLSDELGRHGAQRQRLLLHETREELRRLEAQAARRASERNRLYVSLGALGGLIVSIVLI